MIDLASKPDIETVLKPDMETVLGRIKARKDATGTTLSTEKILEVPRRRPGMTLVVL